jgi:hypothetical protein
MGDRCYVEITVRKCDTEAWESLGYYEQDATYVSGDNQLILADDERNYGVSDTTDDIAPGCPMYGYHEQGGDYPAMIFAFDGEIFLQHECNSNHMPVIECGLTGPCPDDVATAKEFLEFRSKVREMILGTESPIIAE